MDRCIPKPIPSTPCGHTPVLFNADPTLKFKSFVSVLNANYIGSGAVNGTLNEKGESVKRYYCMTATLHVNDTALSNISNYSKSFFLIPTSLYLLTLCRELLLQLAHTEAMRRTNTHTHTHTHTPTFTTSRTTLDERSELAGTSTRQQTTLTIDRNPCHRRNSNPQFQKAICRRTAAYTARPPASDNCSKSKL